MSIDKTMYLYFEKSDESGSELTVLTTDAYGNRVAHTYSIEEDKQVKIVFDGLGNSYIKLERAGAGK